MGKAMALDWNSVRAVHVTEACRQLREGVRPVRLKSTGIFIISEGKDLPAKQVMRVAYLLANNMSLDAKLRFSSGESTVKRLRSLGFQVERRNGSRAPVDEPAADESGYPT